MCPRGTEVPPTLSAPTLGARWPGKSCGKIKADGEPKQREGGDDKVTTDHPDGGPQRGGEEKDRTTREEDRGSRPSSPGKRSCGGSVRAPPLLSADISTAHQQTQWFQRPPSSVLLPTSSLAHTPSTELTERNSERRKGSFKRP